MSDNLDYLCPFIELDKMKPYKCFLRSDFFWSICEIHCVTAYRSRLFILILIVCGTAGLQITSFGTIIVSWKLYMLLTTSILGLALS